MTLTERKFCDECKRAGVTGFSLFLKKNQALGLEEECLFCGWRDEENYFPNRIEEVGFDQAKQEWEENRDSQLNKEIEKEMDFREKAQWEKFKEKTNKLFAPQTYTKRKYCNECQEETVHLKENEEEELEEECLACGWNTQIEFWERERERDGIEHTKKRWEEIRDSELNQKILLELTPEEKTRWDKLVKKTNQLFISENKEENNNPSPFKKYLPYILGGVGIVAVIGLIIALVMNNNKRR
jgi:RNase P subunit RPR2